MKSFLTTTVDATGRLLFRTESGNPAENNNNAIPVDRNKIIDKNMVDKNFPKNSSDTRFITQYLVSDVVYLWDCNDLS